MLMRRTSGFDLHSVRDYQEGESLRKVHWKTTARRGRLMVKELEDTPHDEVAVLLDADAQTAVADNFDVQVRAAGSILRVHALRGRRALLAVTTSPPEYRRVASFDGEWELARGLLASVEPTGKERVEAFLARDSSPAAQAVELVVVTAALSARLVGRARGANAGVPARVTRARARRPRAGARPAPAPPQRDGCPAHCAPTWR